MHVNQGYDQGEALVTFDTFAEHIAFVGLFPVWAPTGMRLTWSYAESYSRNYPQRLDLRSKRLGQAALRLAPKIDTPNHSPVLDVIKAEIDNYMEQRFLEALTASNE